MVTGQSGGGIWHYACYLSSALAAAGLDIALAAPYPYESIEITNGVPVWPLMIRPSDAAPRQHYRMQRVVNHLDKLRRLYRLVVTFRPDIVHLHDRLGQIDFIFLRFLESLGVRIVQTAHDVKPPSGTSNWLDGARYRQAGAVLVHSSNGVKDLKAYGVLSSRIVSIPHANYLHLGHGPWIPPAQAKRLLGIPPSARSILFFGFIAPYKGLSILIDALALLRREDPGVHLVIAGTPLEDFAPYRRQIAALALTEHVISDLRYIPFDEFDKFFSAADVVALPYQRIYQSGVLQLAYAFGRPVMVTNVGGLGDTVAEDCTGVVAGAVDANGVASAIRELLLNPVRADEMGERGRQLAATKYSWDAVARKIIDVYHSLRSASNSRLSIPR